MPVDLSKIGSSMERVSSGWSATNIALGIFGVKMLENIRLQDIFGAKVTQSGKIQQEINKLQLDKTHSLETEAITRNKIIKYTERVVELENAYRKAKGGDKLAAGVARDNADITLQAAEERLRQQQRGRLDIAEKARELEASIPLAKIEDVLKTIGKEWGPSATAFVLMAKSAGEFNRYVIEANSNLKYRRDLFASALSVQLKTGASIEVIGRTYAALRNQGQLYGVELRHSAEEVVMLHEGLGVSVESGAELLAISRSLGTSFEQLSDTLATVVDHTSVTAEQAANIAKTLGRISYGYGFQGADVGGATKLVAALQGQLQKLGVEGRDIAVNLVSGLSDMNKLGGLGMAFGGGPGLAGKGPDKIKAVLTNIGGFLQQFQNNAFVFPQMAEMFGMTNDQANALIESLPKLNGEMAKMDENKIKLEERFHKQSEATNQSWGQLLTSMKALLFDVLTPLLPILNGITWVIDQFRSGLAYLKDSIGEASRVVEWAFGAVVVALTAMAAKAVMTAAVLWATNGARALSMGMGPTASMMGTFAGGTILNIAGEAMGGGTAGDC